VATGAGAETAIDLSWQPNTEADLSGYAVYRREGSENWQRISPAQPLAGPAFHDAHVEPGRIYSYAVTAIDLGGHEGERSAEAEETVSNQ
jgi:fibronectin type 3 domain-containing protein